MNKDIHWTDEGLAAVVPMPKKTRKAKQAVVCVTGTHQPATLRYVDMIDDPTDDWLVFNLEDGRTMSFNRAHVVFIEQSIITVVDKTA